MTEMEDMVKNMTDTFQKNGLIILYAKCSGYDDPTDIQGVQPDVIGWDSQKELYHLGVVADSKIISSDSIKKKIAVLANMMMGVGISKGEQLPFSVGVPKETSDTTVQKINETDLTHQKNIEKIIL